MMESMSLRPARPGIGSRSLRFGHWRFLCVPCRRSWSAPTLLFLATLTAMLLRHQNVPFYEIDRVAFGLLVMGVVGRAMVLRQRLFVVERITWPMLGLTALALATVIRQPFDSETWSLLASKFIVPFVLFHVAGLVFTRGKEIPAI